MIGNITKGNNFKGLLEYLLEKEQSYCLGSNIELEENKVLIVPIEQYLIDRYSKEFNEVAAQKPSLDRPVYHVSLSLPKNKEHLSDRQWEEIAKRYLKERGFENCQYVLVRHNDRDHEHLHIVTSRVSLEGQLVRDSWDYYKSQNTIREIEKDYGLQQIPNSWEVDRTQQTQQEIQLIDRSKEASVRRTLQETIDRHSQSDIQMPELIDRLEQSGIEVQLHQRDEEIGISYKLNEISYAGCSLGSAYSFPGLIKMRSIGYSPDMAEELLAKTSLTDKESKTQTSVALKDLSVNLDDKLSPSAINLTGVALLSSIQLEPELVDRTEEEKIDLGVEMDRQEKQQPEIDNTTFEQNKENARNKHNEENKQKQKTSNSTEQQFFHQELGVAIKQVLRLNESWQKLGQLYSQYGKNPNQATNEAINKQTEVLKNETISTIAQTTKILDPQVGQFLNSSVKLANSWNKLLDLNQQYFDRANSESKKQIKEDFIKQSLEVRRDFREWIAKTTSAINPVVGKVLTNSLEVANEWDKLQQLGREFSKNPSSPEMERTVKTQAKKVLIELGTAYLDLGDDRITVKFKAGIKNYLEELWGVNNDRASNDVEVNKTPSPSSTQNAENQKSTVKQQNAPISLDKSAQQERANPLSQLKQTAISLLNRDGIQRDGITYLNQNQYQISLQSRSNPFNLPPQQALEVGCGCNNLTIEDRSHGRTKLSINFTEEKQLVETNNLTAQDFQNFQLYQQDLNQIEQEFQYKEKLAIQKLRNSPSYDRAMTISKRVDRYLSNVGEKQPDGSITYSQDGFTLEKLNENNLQVVDRHSSTVVLGIKNGELTNFDRNVRAEVLYKDIVKHLNDNQIDETESICDRDLDRFGKYLGLTVSEYGNRDIHNDLNRFENKHFLIEHTYSLEYGIGFEHKLEVFDKHNNNEKILEYRSLESSPNENSPDWQHTHSSLSDEHIQRISHLGKTVDKMTSIKRFGDYASEIVREYGDRAPGQLQSYGHYEDSQYQITIDRQTTIVHDKNQQKNILVIANKQSDLRPELVAHADFTPTDFAIFEKLDRTIAQQRQERLNQQLSKQRSLSSENQLEP